MSEAGQKAELYLNDTLVGRVSIHGFDTAWGYGDFEPLAAFSQFAPLFGTWSLLMHADADDTDQRLSPAAADELRQAEMEIDALDARMYSPAQDEWTKCLQLNIDGPLIEWRKEPLSAEAAKPRRDER